MIYRLDMRITVGDKRMETARHISIKRSLNTLWERCEIHLPKRARLAGNGEAIATATAWEPGCAVSVQLGYNGSLQTEFEGYLYQIDQKNEVVLHCEGISYKLREHRAAMAESNISLKQYLMQALPAGIALNHCPEGGLVNVNMAATGLDLITVLSAFCDDALWCCLLPGKQLWCGFAYSHINDGGMLPGSEKRVYKTGLNLRQVPNVAKNTAIARAVTYRHRLYSGERISATAGSGSPPYSKMLNMVAEQDLLQRLAREKYYMLQKEGADTVLHGFLQPYCQPGDVAMLHHNGTTTQHLIHSVHTQAGALGGSRYIYING